MSTTKPKPPPPLPPKKNGNTPAPNGGVQLEEHFEVTEGLTARAQRIVLYASGGLGKTTLASLMPGRTLFLDVERGSAHLNVKRIDNLSTLARVCAAMTSSVTDAFDNIVIDSVTKIEALAVDETLERVRLEGGAQASSVESYGYGKGYSYVYDTFMDFMERCDGLIARGKNVVLIAHACTANVPNPSGEDFIRFEPRLQNPKSGKSSIQAAVVEWSDHTLFIAYDVLAEKGKGTGHGTRTIYPLERPSWLAKSRTLADPIPFTDANDGAVWDLVFPPTQPQEEQAQ